MYTRIEFKSFDDEYFKYLENEILSHNRLSGEIILIINNYSPNIKDIKDLVFQFFEFNNIKTNMTDYHKKNLKIIDWEITKYKAVESISYGLGIKPNYTKTDIEFKHSEQKMFAYEIIGLFNFPRFFSFKDNYEKLWIRDLDLNDFWSTGGTIIIDNDKIGIFWINDLYDQF